MVLQVATFCLSFMFHHFTISGIWLMLFFAQKSNKFWFWSNSLALPKKRFSQAEDTHMVQHFHIQLFANGGTSQNI